MDRQNLEGRITSSLGGPPARIRSPRPLNASVMRRDPKPEVRGMTCRCAEAYPGGGDRVELFVDVRLSCPALRHVLLPDDAWPLIVAAERRRPDAAFHASYLLLAFERGCLASITAPVHRFLLKGDRTDPRLTAQYRQDLRERWLVEADEVRRHERFRQFFGKIVELRLAYWIANRDFNITALEALGGNADIVAESPAGDTCSFEVKYIGQETNDFREVVRALAGETAGGAISPYTAANYLLFRTYEAARRLRGCEGAPVVVIVIDASSWPRFEGLLKRDCIHWDTPVFLQAPDEWGRFLLAQRRRYPDLDTELAAIVTSVSLWILRATDDYDYILEYEVVHANNA